jgi:acyl-CoA reductase-like NAD-dependent aldehyde dehydrogenase
MDSIHVKNPATEEIVFQITPDTLGEARAALSCAQHCQSQWKKEPISKRIDLCINANAEFKKAKSKVAEEITLQMGKPIKQSLSEVEGMIFRSQKLTEIAESSLEETTLPPLPGFSRKITREPLGVVLNIPAWNYPLLTAVNVVVPAILSGNAVILKHSSKTPLCGNHFEDAFKSAGAPEGLVTSLHLDHRVTADLISDPRIAHVSFTGSVRGGREVYQAAAQHRFIDVGLELGGKDPAYVRSDADLFYAAKNLAEGAFYNAGQSCCGVKRIYVHHSIFQDFLNQFLEETKNYRAGNPVLESTNMGPLVDQKAVEHLESQVSSIPQQGGELVLGGKRTRVDGFGFFFEPTVVVGSPQQSRVNQEESFGPLVTFNKVASDEEAIIQMNESHLGLSASLWTSDENKAYLLGEQLETGTVFMNRCDYLDPILPWSGVKDTGKGATLSPLGFFQLTRPKAYHFKTEVK